MDTPFSFIKNVLASMALILSAAEGRTDSLLSRSKCCPVGRLSRTTDLHPGSGPVRGTMLLMVGGIFWQGQTFDPLVAPEIVPRYNYVNI